MSVQITIDDRAAIAMLDRLRASGANMAAVHDEIGVAFEQQIKLAFDDQRDPWGQAWAALSPVTVARRRKGSSTPLNDIGLLRQSVEYKADGEGVLVSVGRADRPAAPHQFGNPKNRMFGKALAPLPARPMMPIDDTGVRFEGTEYGEILLDIADAFLEEATT